jgi:radical SAM protein with 4Fe4S-binding SPASM domain
MELPNRFAGWLTINRLCNLNCQWCYAKSLAYAKEHDMNLGVLDKTIKLFKGLPLENVILIGGEPTIHPNFFKIIENIEKAGLKPLLVTNGVKLAEESFLQTAIDKGLKGIVISLKTGNEEQYYKLTGKSVFRKVTRAIDNIDRKEVPHKVSVTVGKYLFENFDQIIDVIAKRGNTSLSLDMERPIISNGTIQDSDMASPQEMADFFVSIYPKLVANCKRFVIKISIPFCLFPESFISLLFKNNHIVSGCQIFDGKGIIVDPKGRILPCNHFCDNPLGEIGVDFSSAEEYYEFRKRPDIERFYRKIASCPDYNCVNCKYWQYCGAGCRVHWLAKGSEQLIGNFQRGGD